MTWTMNGIFRIAVTLLFCSVASLTRVHAQIDSARFDRPSLCLMMIAHPEQAFGKEIEIVFREMDMPERFNDHSLGVRVVKFPTDKQTSTEESIMRFADHAQLAKKMVAKWFGRDKNTGSFNTYLFHERGLYNATKSDWENVRHTIMGAALLADAGEKLISHTFLVMCEFTYNRAYSTKSNADSHSNVRSQTIDVSNAEAVDEYNNYLYQKDNRLKQFELTCTSYLYRLDWNDSVANEFYMRYYMENADPDKAAAFQQDQSTFKLSYVGNCTDKEVMNNPDGRYTNQQLIKSVCIRLRDKNIATLQHAHPEFRIKSLLSGTNPLKADIGLKEDVTPDSRYEVLMPVFSKNGTYTYQRVGVIQPVAGQIWDNRYMVENHDKQGESDATTFKQVSGGEIVPGMLIKEMDIK